MDMDALQIVQLLVGLGLFLASGYALTLALFSKDDIDDIERVVFSLSFSIMVPALVLLVANLVLKVRMDTFSVYGVYLGITAAGLAYWYKFRRVEHGHHKAHAA